MLCIVCCLVLVLPMNVVLSCVEVFAIIGVVCVCAVCMRCVLRVKYVSLCVVCQGVRSAGVRRVLSVFECRCLVVCVLYY